MNRIDLAELIRNGENSGVEFKRDDIRPEQLAKEIAGFLNLEGGYILLGVEDDGSVTGLTRTPREAEEWVMQAARVHVQPGAIPFWRTVQWREETWIGIVSLPSDAPDKPYKFKRGQTWVTQVRVGTTTRDATNPEEMRLYQQSGHLQYDHKPVPGSSIHDLDRRRLINHFRDLRRQNLPPWENRGAWVRLLVNTGLMIEQRGNAMPSAGGLLLFGKHPNAFLPQAGINAAAYPGLEKDYNASARAILRGPAVSLFPAPDTGSRQPYPEMPETFSDYTDCIETGLIEQAMDFVRRNIEIQAWIDRAGRRQERWSYLMDTIREAVVNAVAHRDYTITVRDIELSLYADRLEIVSPGRLPNTVTVEKMRAGYSATRNELIKQVLREYRYIEAVGLGVPRKIIAGMRAHNGTEPDLIEEEDHFIVRLWRDPPEARTAL